MTNSFSVSTEERGQTFKRVGTSNRVIKTGSQQAYYYLLFLTAIRCEKMILGLMKFLLQLRPQRSSMEMFLYFYQWFYLFAALSQVFPSCRPSKLMLFYSKMCFLKLLVTEYYFRLISICWNYFPSFQLCCCLFPYCFSIIFRPFWGHKPYSIFPLPLISSKWMSEQSFRWISHVICSCTQMKHIGIIRSSFFQLRMTLLWLITFLLVQKLDRRLVSADIRFTYLSNSDLWNRQMKQHKCKAISQPDLQRYEIH